MKDHINKWWENEMDSDANDANKYIKDIEESEGIKESVKIQKENPDDDSRQSWWARSLKMHTGGRVKSKEIRSGYKPYQTKYKKDLEIVKQRFQEDNEIVKQRFKDGIEEVKKRMR